MGCGHSKVATADLVREVTAAANETLEMETCLKTRLEAVENRQEDGFTRNQQSERTLLQRQDVVNRELNTKVETAERNVLSKLIEVQETDDSKTDAELDNSDLPKVRPPRRKKEKLLNDFFKKKNKAPLERESADLFSNIDDIVKRTPLGVSRSVDSLAKHLMTQCPSDLEKVRAFTSWITLNIKYDKEGGACSPFKRPPQDSKTVLATRKAVCAGFSQLFADLCTVAQIPCVVVRGHSKGISYDREQEFTKDTEVNHNWNMVHVQGDWRLLDVTWAAQASSESHQGQRGILSGSGEQRTAKQIVIEHWFLTDPEEFAADHFPVMKSGNSEAHQLLKRPLSIQEFSRRPKLSDYAYDMGLKLTSHRQTVIDVTNDVTITMRATRQQLQYVDVTLEKHRIPGAPKERSCVLTSLSDDGVCTIYVRPPEAATYLLTVMGSTEANSKTELLTYVIRCKRAQSQQQQPFPDKLGHWGILGPVAGDSGFKLRRSIPFRHNANSKGLVQVALPLKNFVNLSVKLMHASKMSEDLSQYACISYEMESSSIRGCTSAGVKQATILARLPNPGYYQLQIFAGLPTQPSLSAVGDILLFAKHGCQNADPYPEKCTLGLKLPLATECGLKAAKTHNVVKTKDGQAKVVLELLRYTELKVNLYHATRSPKENMNKFAFIELTEKKAVIQACLPEPGNYKLSVFAKHPDQDTMPLVGNFLLQAKAGSKIQDPFPGESCVLGLKPIAAECGLKALNAPFCVKAQNGTAEIRLPFSRSTQLQAHLYSSRTKETSIVKDTEIRNDEGIIRVRLPEGAGCYRLTLFAKHPNQTQLPEVGKLFVFTE